MILHYLKIAVRNLWKYRTQSIISMLGLAIGFACVALAVYWNHYEMTYDAFQKNAHRVYRVRKTDPYRNEVSSITPAPLAQYLQKNYPEVESACVALPARPWPGTSIEGTPLPEGTTLTTISPEGLDIFGIGWIEGNKDMASWKNTDVAISRHMAMSVCGTASPIGKKVKFQNGKEGEIVGLFEDWPAHSNLKFDFISRMDASDDWAMNAYHTYVMLHADADFDGFIQKVKTDTIQGNNGAHYQVFDVIIPVTEMRYTYPEANPNIRFEDVRLFTMAAVLLALCALLNYLTLFISRIRNKGRNMALRTIYGSSGWQLSALLMTEYLLLLLCSLLFTMLFIEIVALPFMDLAQIQLTRFQLYGACAYLLAFVVALAMLLSFIPIYYFKQKTLRVQIEVSAAPLGRNMFRLTSVCLQLVVSILFMFCATVMMKQVYSLAHSDININRTKIAWCMVFEKNDVVAELIKQMPGISEAMLIPEPLYPVGSGTSASQTNSWEGKSADDETVRYQMIWFRPEVGQFYGLKMKEGPATFELDKKEVFINEAMAKAMNMDKPVGKMLDEVYRIKGVIEDFQNQPPTKPIAPMVFFAQRHESQNRYIAFTYTGDFDTHEKAISGMLKKEGIKKYFSIKDGERTYDEYLKSENNLLKLLGIVTLVSLLIALFGIYALIVQSCEQHRKGIALRKVYGAQVKDILILFFKQYMVQVLVASAIAFPVGYALMKRWLEGYSRQTEISLWIFLAIFVSVSVLVMLCIGWRVWKAANENPADVVKSE